MKNRFQASIFWIITFVFLIGLACSVPTSMDTSQIEEILGTVMDEVIDTVADSQSGQTQPPTPPPSSGQTQPPAPLPAAPAGMVAVPAGTFLMGCNVNVSGDDCYIGVMQRLPLHTVYLDGFYIDKYEVTNNQYAQCVAAGICEVPVWHPHYETGEMVFNDYHYGKPEYGNYPVTLITWNDANNYCAWSGKSLPTEAQWEKAARGTSDTREWPWGNNPPTCALENFREHSVGGEGFCGDYSNFVATSAVGSHPNGASQYGVMDMAGNVTEFILDRANSDYYEMYEPNAWPANPIQLEGLDYVVRGGAWTTAAPITSVSYRSASGGGPENFLGFRCVSSP